MIKRKTKFVQTSFETEELGAKNTLMQDAGKPNDKHGSIMKNAEKELATPIHGSIVEAGKEILNHENKSVENIVLNVVEEQLFPVQTLAMDLAMDAGKAAAKLFSKPTKVR